MKTRTVEIEIPEDMEVVSVRPNCYNSDYIYLLAVELSKRKPKRFVFEEVIGSTSVARGDYLLDRNNNMYYATCTRHLLDDEIALRKIEE